jgi:hypothetical protein
MPSLKCFPTFRYVSSKGLRHTIFDSDCRKLTVGMTDRQICKSTEQTQKIILVKS